MFSKTERYSKGKTCTFGEKEQEGEQKKGKLMIIKPNLHKAEVPSLCCLFCIYSHHRFMKNWKKHQENSGREYRVKKQASLGRFQLTVGMWNSCQCLLIR